MTRFFVSEEVWMTFRDYLSNVDNVEMETGTSSNKKHVICVFKILEEIIKNKNKKYQHKIESLIMVWDQLALAMVSDSCWVSFQSEFQSLYSYTLKFVLMPAWESMSVATHTHMKTTIQRFADSIQASDFRIPCRVLLSVLRKPWSSPMFDKILRNEEVEFQELLEYFGLENGEVIVTRLEMMLEQKCEEHALQLAKAWLTTFYESEQPDLDYNQLELDYITDVYIGASYSTKMNKGLTAEEEFAATKELTTEFKLYGLEEGVDILQRYKRSGGIPRSFRNRNGKVRFWKRSDEIFEMLANVWLANAVVHDDLIKSDTILSNLISLWASSYKPEVDRKFPQMALQMVGKLVLVANTSRCIYPFCSFLLENYDCEEVIKWLIRAVYKDMNEIEQCRVNRDYEKLKSAYERLADGFVMISKLFNHSKSICGQCLLASFSMAPSHERLQRLETFVHDTPSAIFNSSQTADPSSQSAEEGDNEVEPAYVQELENLTMEECIKLDLITVLRYQQNCALSLELEWSELKMNCEKYLEAFKARGFNYEVELKYLDLDYRLYKDRPINEDDYIGIEKGYEQFIEIDPQIDAKDEFVDDFYDTQSSHDDTDEDEDYVLQKSKKQISKRKKNGRKSRFVANEFNNWENVVMSPSNNPRDKKMIVRLRKRKMSSQRSDSDEGCAKRSRSSNKGDNDILEVCVPNQPGTDDLFKRYRAPVLGKRLTMRFQIPQTLKVEREVRSRKRKIAKTEGYSDLNEELQTMLQSFEATNISSPAKCGSPSRQTWQSSRTDSEFCCDNTIQSSGTETGVDRTIKRQPGDDDDTKPTIEPIIIRRHVIEEDAETKREWSPHQPKKLKKKVVYTTSKRSASKISQPRTSTKRSNLKKLKGTHEPNADSYEWNPIYTPLFLTSAEDITE